MNNCIKCGLPTKDKTRVKAPIYFIFICKSHKDEILADNEKLDANKKFFHDKKIANDENVPDLVKHFMATRMSKSPRFSVYANYLAKKEIKLLTQEDLDKYEEKKKELKND